MGRVDYSIEFNLDRYDSDYYKKKIRKAMKSYMLASYGNEMGPQGAKTVGFEYTLD